MHILQIRKNMAFGSVRKARIPNGPDLVPSWKVGVQSKQDMANRTVNYPFLAAVLRAGRF
jgi:hypothetical protein